MTEGPKRFFRKAIHPKTRGVEFVGYRKETRDGVTIERDVGVPIRGGRTLYADVYRPHGATGIPAIICYAPFGKTLTIDLEHAFPGSDIPFEKLSKETPFEVFDPMRWAREGFAICVVDGVGNWYSEGRAEWFVKSEAEAGYDVVEWFSGRDWCNGNVGWGGVSYYAMTAWAVAALKPPHLKAILPWDAASDNYRETNFQGGIPLHSLTHMWMTITGVGLGEVEDWEIGSVENPLWNEFWSMRMADWGAVEVPTYAVTEWGNNLHLRGTVEAWKAIASPQKYLDICGGKEWAEFYAEWAFERQRAFLGEYLKEENNGVRDWSPVRIALRENGQDWVFREEAAFPLERAHYVPFYLDTARGRLSKERPETEASTRYPATDDEGKATFDIEFDEDTEITGNCKLRLWISSEHTCDADVFVGLQKLDCNGNPVPFVYSQMFNDGPAAYGHLRASHRELDEERSRPEQPWHRHQRQLWMQHGEPVPLDIEIWPTNIVIRKGEGLRLTVKGTDIYIGKGGFVLRHSPSINIGEHIVHSGDSYDSHLLLPIIR